MEKAIPSSILRGYMEAGDKVFRQLEQLLESIPAALVLIDQEGKVLFYNEEARNLFGASTLLSTGSKVPPALTLRLGDLVSCRNRTLSPLGCGFSHLCPACEFFRMIRPRCQRLHEPFRITGLAQVFRDRLPPILWFRYTARPLHWGGRRVLAISLEDITSLKVKEEELDVRRAHFEHLFQHAPVAIALLDEEDRFLDCNLQFSQLFQYTLEEIRGKPINDLIVPPDLQEETSSISYAVLGGTLVQKESVRQKKDGTRFPVSILGAPITISGKRYVYAIYQDISVRKEMERKILALLREKELILKEVHHRIKNNMALVISLLSLQRSFLRDSDGIKALEAAEGRIRSMEVLYDKLYRSESIQSVPLSAYFQALVEEILSLFPESGKIQRILTISPLTVDPKTLSSLGLIVNELITNSMKYAFKGRESGSIFLQIEENCGSIRLQYEDDGVGLPEGFSLEGSEGFGLQLVTLLTEQLGGTLHIEKGRGARFVLEFPYTSPSVPGPSPMASS